MLGIKKFYVGIGCFLMVSATLWGEDFITKNEYAQMLYSNPRGIGCNKCHGERGEGAIIAHYSQKGKKTTLEAPNIKNLTKERFYQALSTSHKVMPTYFLTRQEIDSLYYYVSSVSP